MFDRKWKFHEILPPQCRFLEFQFKKIHPMKLNLSFSMDSWNVDNVDSDIELTERSNYRQFSSKLHNQIVASLSMFATIDQASKSAMRDQMLTFTNTEEEKNFRHQRKLNLISDNFLSITRGEANKVTETLKNSIFFIQAISRHHDDGQYKTLSLSILML